MGTRVLISGANGKVGRELVKGIRDESTVRIVGAVGRQHGIGADIGVLAGQEPLGIKLSSDLKGTIVNTAAEVVVDFTQPQTIMENLTLIAEAGAHAVIGTTGITETDIPEITAICNKYQVNAIISPNFALGAILLLRFAEIAARFFPNVEIIETHHNQKLDAPSGTAIKYAEAIVNSAKECHAATTKIEKLSHVRGGELDGVRVHSLRLPGFVAHHEIVFGGLGQSLTLKHDSISRQSFVPGVLLAIKQVKNISGVVYGLENLLDL